MTSKRTITATFEIVTPMFLGGADQQASRIRETSIKGALAFWWRALNYADFVTKTKGDLNKALKDMQKAEQRLFGGGECGQSGFLLKVSKQNVISSTDRIATENNSKLAYIARGLLNHNGNMDNNRNYLLTGGKFCVEVVFKPRTSSSQIGEFAKSLEAFGLLGGLGSRVRRGWGAVALESIRCKGIEIPEMRPLRNRLEYIEQIKTLLNGHLPNNQSGKKWRVTAFSDDSAIRVGTVVHKSTLEALNELATGMQNYRGWETPMGSNFKTDHDWFKSANNRRLTGFFIDSDGVQTAVETLPNRSVFGLPHNYFSPAGRSPTGNDLKMSIDGPDKQKDRRASPLIFHIHKTADENSMGMIIYLPTMFLPENENGQSHVRVNNKCKKHRINWSVIENFLDGKRPDGTTPSGGDYFPSEKVFP